jgi:hypothetical protein
METSQPTPTSNSSDIMYIRTEDIVKILQDDTSSSQSIDGPKLTPSTLVISDSFTTPIKASDIDVHSLDLSAVKTLRIEPCSLRGACRSNVPRSFASRFPDGICLDSDIIDLIQKMPSLESLTVKNCTKFDTINFFQRLIKLDHVPSIRRLKITDCSGKFFNTKEETFQLLKSLVEKVPSLEELYIDSIGPLTWNQILYLSKKLKRFRFSDPTYLRRGCPVVFDGSDYIRSNRGMPRIYGFGTIESTERFFSSTKIGLKLFNFPHMHSGFDHLGTEMPPFIYSDAIVHGVEIDIKRLQVVYIDEETRIPELLDLDGNLIAGDPFPDTPESLELIKKLNRKLEDGEDVEILQIKVQGKFGGKEPFCLQSYMDVDDIGEEDLNSYDAEDEYQRVQDNHKEEEWRRAHPM